MGTDLHAAAERLRRIACGERQRAVYGFDDEVMDDFMYRMLENKYVADLGQIAAFALPLLDPTPITESALVEMGLEQRSENGYTIGCGLTLIFDSGDCGMYFMCGNRFVPIVSIATRGQLHTLCRALGIEFKEQDHD